MFLSRTVIVAAAFVAATGPSFAQEAGDAEDGARVFRQCQACHRIGPDAKNAIGPELNGVVGRAAGSVPGYQYSDAMASSGITWDEATLTTYLHAPREFVPGTKMTFAGLRKDDDIADVIAYLKRFDTSGRSGS